MQEYIINVAKIEELQTIGNINELDTIFDRAQRTIVNGEKVILTRKQNETSEKFDEFSTLDELTEYRNRVYKYF